MNPSTIIRDRHGYMQECELFTLQKVISKLPNNSICVNIGAGFGTSGLAFIESPEVGMLYTIEKFEYIQDNGLGSLEFERNVFREFGFDKDVRYRPLLSDSIEMGIVWKIKHDEVDMVFIDGDHSYEHCKGDIEAWLPNIKKGGVIAFHDYGKMDGLYGVSTAVDELITGRYELIAYSAAFIAFRV